VLVTGAARGIGPAIARSLARDGFDLVLGYHQSKAAAESLAAELSALGRRASPLAFDVSDREACASAIGAELGAHGPCWGAVLCAGVNQDAPFAGLSGEAWDRVLRTNLDGFYNVLRPLVMPLVRLRQGGRIVAISSLAGIAGNRGQVNYAASKAGLIGAAKSLALELASRRITVNCVAPGWIGTEMLAGLDLEAMARQVPLERLGTPEDVAAAVSFLCSDGASYITGQVLCVDGGLR
jgi:3-oxoacyl-[acyl-carrier protein] reductase